MGMHAEACAFWLSPDTHTSQSILYKSEYEFLGGKKIIYVKKNKKIKPFIQEKA
jgi:hypothetical protein